MTLPFNIIASMHFGPFGFPFRLFGPFGGHFGHFRIFPFTPIFCILIIGLLILGPRLGFRRSSMNTNPRDTGIAYLLLLFGGVLGLHKFYLNRTGWGVVYIFTGGLFGVGLIIDLFTLPAQVRRCNHELGIPPAVPPPQPSAFASSAEAFARASARVDAFARRLDDLETVIYAQRRK
jgi:TM2 domain-containing membrane protein YozV